jgi:hypothetical protein
MPLIAVLNKIHSLVVLKLESPPENTPQSTLDDVASRACVITATTEGDQYFCPVIVETDFRKYGENNNMAVHIVGWVYEGANWQDAEERGLVEALSSAADMAIYTNDLITTLRVMLPDITVDSKVDKITE